MAPTPTPTTTTSKNKGSDQGGIIKLKIAAKKLQKSINLLGKKANNVPGDVKQGHFAVLAIEGEEEPKRFVVPLSYLTHPTFLRLLEQAADEFGFNGREGALVVPCPPSELERILAEQWEKRASSNSWGCSSSSMTVVQSF